MIILSLLFFGGFVLILLMVGGVYMSRMEMKGDGQIMKKIYIYLVLFATLMMSIGGGVSIFMNLADLIAPTSYYQTYEEFKMMYVDKGDQTQTISEDEMRTKYAQAKQEDQNQEIARAKNGIIKSLGWIIIPLPIFIFFQRRLGKVE